MKLSAKKIEKKAKQIKVIGYECVDSTNIIAKELALNGAKEGTLVVATEQTNGKGRLGRSFFSKKGGVYFSIVLRPQKTVEDTLFITAAAAIAVCHAIESISDKKCEIKWVNDVYIKEKKVCGILTEGEINSGGTLEYAILGVGINLFAPKGDFPDYLPLADSVFDKKCKILFKNRIKEQLIVEFANKFFALYNKSEHKKYIKEYQQRSFLTGKDITYTKDGVTYNAKVTGIDDNARLIVNKDGKTDVLSHGEIQIVGMEQPTI